MKSDKYTGDVQDSNMKAEAALEMLDKNLRDLDMATQRKKMAENPTMILKQQNEKEEAQNKIKKERDQRRGRKNRHREIPLNDEQPKVFELNAVELVSQSHDIRHQRNFKEKREAKGYVLKPIRFHSDNQTNSRSVRMKTRPK